MGDAGSAPFLSRRFPADLDALLPLEFHRPRFRTGRSVDACAAAGFPTVGQVSSPEPYSALRPC